MQKKKDRIANVRKQFFDTVPSKIHYDSENESIFSKQFLSMLKKCLVPPNQFNRMNAAKRRKVFNKIQNLVLIETDWKAIISKVKFENDIVEKMFFNEMRMFISNYESYFFPPKNETHSQIRAKYGSEKTKKFVYQLLLFLKEKELQFLNEFPWSELLKEETLKSVQECESNHFTVTANGKPTKCDLFTYKVVFHVQRQEIRQTSKI